MNAEMMHARRAIESLRSGVPNRDVVAQLGTTQSEIRDRFQDSLDSIERGEGTEPILISATFGAGKTHLLSYLQSLAEQQGFVTSYVVVSPEMPLGNAQAVCKALAEAAKAPGRTGRALRTLASELSSRPDALAETSNWMEMARVDDRFRALVRLYDAYRADDEFRLQVLGDFEGRGLLKNVIKGRLKQIHEAGSFDLNGPKSALLSGDRIRSLAQLYKAGGCKGWVILFDEMERVAKFSLKQRLAAYAQLGWWRRIANTAGSGILPVFTTASGFVAETVTGGAHDEMRLATRVEGDELSRDARDGVDFLKAPLRIGSPSVEQEAEIEYRVRSLYEQAYGVSLDPNQVSNDVRISIRSRIRGWITEWDITRHHPDYRGRVAVEQVRFDTEGIGDNLADIDEDDD